MSDSIKIVKGMKFKNGVGTSDLRIEVVDVCRNAVYIKTNENKRVLVLPKKSLIDYIANNALKVVE